MSSSAVRSAVASPGSSSRGHSAAHDPAHPPIDCPLRKSGVDPAALKPFDDVEKYIAFLERPDRALWQKPDALVASLGLQGNEIVADVGAGSGYFTFRFARALASGTVVAIDVEPEMVRHVHHRAMSEGIANVRAQLSEPEDPKLPAGTSVVFICDVLHHVLDRSAWLGRVRAEVAPGTQLVIVEFKDGDLPQGPPASMKLPKAEVRQLVTASGFRFVSEDVTLLPYQYVVRFERTAG
jgi:ubiquinone/menaquinone biosynthesis C-methylase UbiE